MRSRKGKDCWGPGCVLEACFYCCTLFLYYLGFGLIRFILPIAPCSLGGASLRVSEKIIHWEISKMPSGKEFQNNSKVLCIDLHRQSAYYKVNIT